MLWRNFYGNGNRFRGSGNRTLWPNTSMWRDMRRFQQEMESLLGGVRSPATSFPALNIYSGEEGIILTAEIPGVEPDELEITVLGETLTLSGSRNGIEAGDEIKYHRRERGQGQFTRTVELPFRVDSDKVEAKFNNGVLHIMLPRVEEEKPRKISVKAIS